jgi:Leucine-rich repeat (LRR) protein
MLLLIYTRTYPMLNPALLPAFVKCSNNLTDLPDSISELQAIRILRFKYNQLRRVPCAISRLPQLLSLELSGNQITRLDSGIAHVRGACWSGFAVCSDDSAV